MSLKQHNYGCTVKQKFAFDSKMATSLGTKAHLKIQIIVFSLLCYYTIYIQSFNMTLKSEGEKSTEVK